MREIDDKLNELLCDRCGAGESKETEVWEWGNPYDHGTICSNCHEDDLDNR